MPWFALDLDGTLVTCREKQVELLRALLVERGLDPALADATWPHKRRGLDTRAALVALGVAAEDAAAILAAWARWIEDDRWIALDRPFDDVPEALARLRAAGLAVMILTARRDPAAVARQVANLALPADDLVVVSPGAAATEKAAALARVAARGFVGDTESDARAAALAGVRFAAVATGQRDATYLTAAGLTVYPTLVTAVDAVLKAAA